MSCSLRLLRVLRCLILSTKRVTMFRSSSMNHLNWFKVGPTCHRYNFSSTALLQQMQISAASRVKVIENVSPPPGLVPTTTLPLTFFDTVYLVTLRVPWMQRLFFYQFEHPTLHFTQTVLPDLKTSLSLALKHFFPFAGNLVFPLPPHMPYIIYKEGDSVSFVVKESKADFNHLVGDHARDYSEFQALVPEVPPAIASVSSSDGCKQQAVMAIQITVFPNAGFSIGVGFSHVVADGRSFAHFMKSWASIHSRQGDSTCLNNYLPCHDRDLIDDPLELASILTKRTFQGPSSPNISLNNSRVTYKLKRSEVELLKDWVKTKCMEVKGSVPSEPIPMSTFAVACSYLWICLIKLQQLGARQHLDSNAISYFLFAADCRDHLRQPETYFGNCLMLCLTSAKKCELLGENGILVATTAIGSEIMEFRKQPFKDAQESLPKTIEINRAGRDIVVAISSSKFGLYNTDFGWGRPRKTEVGTVVSFGSQSMICIAESREEEGGVEFALAFDSHDLDSFNAIFTEGLLKLQQSDLCQTDD